MEGKHPLETVAQGKKHFGTPAEISGKVRASSKTGREFGGAIAVSGAGGYLSFNTFEMHGHPLGSTRSL